MIWFSAYVLTILTANWALQTFGLVPIGFGLMAPAGVFFAGLAFTLRDLTQDSLGRWLTILAIATGATLSALVSPQLALASGSAFLLSELADMLVYSPLRERHWLFAVALSNTVGLLIDSALFLWLAFGSLDYLLAQIVGKTEVSLVTVAVLWAWRQRAHVSVGST